MKYIFAILLLLNNHFYAMDRKNPQTKYQIQGEKVHLIVKDKKKLLDTTKMKCIPSLRKVVRGAASRVYHHVINKNYKLQ